MSKQFSQEIFDAIASLNHELRSRLHTAARSSEHSVSGMEFRALNFFARRPGSTQKDLVEHSGRDKAQIARIISNLKNLELIEATPDEQDRRASRLHLTARGQQITDEFRAINRQLVGQAIEGLDENECRTLLSLLARMNANLEDKE